LIVSGSETLLDRTLVGGADFCASELKMQR
jgi:hypothetical protein